MAIECNLTRAWRSTLEVSRTSNSCRGLPQGSSKTTIHTEPALSISPTIGCLLMSGRRLNSDSGEPDWWSNGSVFMGSKEPISVDPSPQIPLQQTTAISGCDSIDPPRFSAHAPFSLRTFPSLDHLWCIDPTSLKAAVGARSSSPANVEFAPEAM